MLRILLAVFTYLLCLASLFTFPLSTSVDRYKTLVMSFSVVWYFPDQTKYSGIAYPDYPGRYIYHVQVPNNHGRRTSMVFKRMFGGVLLS